MFDPIALHSLLAQMAVLAHGGIELGLEIRADRGRPPPPSKEPIRAQAQLLGDDFPGRAAGNPDLNAFELKGGIVLATGLPCVLFKDFMLLQEPDFFCRFRTTSLSSESTTSMASSAPMALW